MTAQELFDAGQLDEAIQAALQEVKNKPMDEDRRFRLVLLLCLNGELDKAEQQLTMLAKQHPEAAVGSALFRQLIRAEMARQEFHDSGRVPDFMGEPNELLKQHLQASISLREGNRQEAAGLLQQAEEMRPRISGTCDGQEFKDLRDLDDMLAPVVEAMTSTGKYYWIPLSEITSLKMDKPESLADVLWRPVQLRVRHEPPGAVYLPTLYVGSCRNEKSSIRLGRETEWIGLDDPPVQGCGLRMFLIGEDARSILEFEKLELNTSDPATDEVSMEQGDG